MIYSPFDEEQISELLKLYNFCVIIDNYEENDENYTRMALLRVLLKKFKKDVYTKKVHFLPIFFNYKFL